VVGVVQGGVLSSSLKPGARRRGPAPEPRARPQIANRRRGHASATQGTSTEELPRATCPVESEAVGRLVGAPESVAPVVVIRSPRSCSRSEQSGR